MLDLHFCNRKSCSQKNYY